MRIATWNLNRPTSSSVARNDGILRALKAINPDILILTETNSLIHPGDGYKGFPTSSLVDFPSKKGEEYKEGENRVTVWTRYSEASVIETYDPFSTSCVSVCTPFGGLNVYGTVIGAYGSRDEGFNLDLNMQIADWQRLCLSGGLCIAGDFNISFDNYYFTKDGRGKIADCFQELKVDMPTRQIPENIDHIAVSESFLNGLTCETKVWNEDKKLSDHKGVCLEFNRS